MLRKAWFQLAVLGAAALLVFVLTLVFTGTNWDLAIMATSAALILLLAAFTLLRARLKGSEVLEPFPVHREPVALPEAAPGPAEDDETLADRYYFKGAWFTVIIHPETEEQKGEDRRFDLTGPLCPACDAAMLPAHDREPPDKEGRGHTHVYKCSKSTLHKVVALQLTDPAPLMDQARRACLSDLVTGRFTSPRANEEEASSGDTPAGPTPDSRL